MQYIDYKITERKQ